MFISCSVYIVHGFKNLEGHTSILGLSIDNTITLLMKNFFRIPSSLLSPLPSPFPSPPSRCIAANMTTRLTAHNSRAAVLYSDLSGEEILQQWLDLHPEVMGRHAEEERKSGGRKKGKTLGRQEGEEDAVASGSTRAVQSQRVQTSHEQPYSSPAPFRYTAAHSLPPELEPFRAVLPPSLLPLSDRISYPCSMPSDSPGWG